MADACIAQMRTKQEAARCADGLHQEGRLAVLHDVGVLCQQLAGRQAGLRGLPQLVADGQQ
jgi:hypothetical protein